ncbi:PhoH family protein [Pseudoclavibacter sp. CFCC 11306]|uniref:PhoH family protein n=1 Tax=Pseudoclavibacter sp. CFCC 11306 TaxID=1564493 RepID=UPI001300D886|nr:PhoH family protein [Pseudoclavibacter sp. CFCC 11306]
MCTPTCSPARHSTRENLPDAASESTRGTVRVPLSTSAVRVLGAGDLHLRRMEEQWPGLRFQVDRDGIEISGSGEQRDAAARLIEGLDAEAHHRQITGAVVDAVLRQQASTALGSVIVGEGTRSVRPKTAGQQRYVEAIDENVIVFGLGPAGTGKTYLAMAKAVQALQRNEVSRIVLTRPAVEAGERLGFLPGGLQEKIDPYLRPLYDALGEMMSPESVQKLLELGVIEVAPLAYMRGRTLNSSFIILDEAQNTTPEQMKMFLTRLGFGSRMVVTGDSSQVDLPVRRSGLIDAERVLGDVADIEMVHLSSDDVVRHGLVSAIIEAYDDRAAAAESRGAPSAGEPADAREHPHRHTTQPTAPGENDGRRTTPRASEGAQQ